MIQDNFYEKTKNPIQEVFLSPCNEPIKMKENYLVK